MQTTDGAAAGRPAWTWGRAAESARIERRASDPAEEIRRGASLRIAEQPGMETKFGTRSPMLTVFLIPSFPAIDITRKALPWSCRRRGQSDRSRAQSTACFGWYCRKMSARRYMLIAATMWSSRSKGMSFELRPWFGRNVSRGQAAPCHFTSSTRPVSLSYSNPTTSKSGISGCCLRRLMLRRTLSAGSAKPPSQRWKSGRMAS